MFGQNLEILLPIYINIYEGCSEIIETLAKNQLYKSYKFCSLSLCSNTYKVPSYGIQVIGHLRRIFHSWDIPELRKVLVSGALQCRKRNVMTMKHILALDLKCTLDAQTLFILFFFNWCINLSKSSLLYLN